MKTREATADQLTSAGVIAVVRLKSSEKALPLVNALVAGGIRAIEITITTPGALSIIETLSATAATDVLIGVGSVLTKDEANNAIRAGARFVVSPIGNHELVPVCHAQNIPVMLGAYTPTEAQSVHEHGADFVKIFPADTLGPGYIKSLLAPLPHLRVVPTGGVDLNNLKQFRLAGCKAVGIGSSLISAEWQANDDWERMQVAAKSFVESWKMS